MKNDLLHYKPDYFCDPHGTTLQRFPINLASNDNAFLRIVGHGRGIGHLTSLTDQAGSLSLNYEERGLVTANNRTIGGNAYNTGFAYQSAGRLVTLTYASSGWAVGYTYDTAGQVTTVTDKPPSASAVNLATSVTHMPFGPVKSMTYGNGITDARSFDLDYRTTAIKDLNGATGIYYSSFGYNAANNVTSITDNVTHSLNQTLTYDSANQLKFASGTYGTSGLTLSYDSSGNRKAYGSTTYTINSASNRLSAVGASSLTFTSSGNITAWPSATATYNKANQLATAVVSSTTSTFLYDAFGNRLSTVVGTARSNIQSYGPNNEILTEANGGVKTDYAYLDGFPIAAIQPAASTVSALHTNYLGTPQIGTNSAKAVVWSGSYDPNGNFTVTTGSITQNLRFPGQYLDASGLQHNGFRDYVPKFASGGGRYLESDPIGLAGGINPYVYGNNNTYSNIDLTGLLDRLVFNGQSLIGYDDMAVEFSVPAVSGPYGLGALPNGTYNGQILRVRNDDKGMICKVASDAPPGWSLNLNPSFITSRNDLRIHPDGNVPGTLGCIGVACANQATAYKALLQFFSEPGPANRSIPVTVDIPMGAPK